MVFLRTQSGKWITVKWLNHMANNYNRWLGEESLKTPLLSRPILISFEFRCQPNHLLFYSLAQLINCNKIHVSFVFSYSEMVPVSYLFLSFFFRFVSNVILYFIGRLVFINIFLYCYFIYLLFICTNYSIFSCSGMFRVAKEGWSGFIIWWPDV